MKALIYHGKNDLRCGDVAAPSPAAGEALLDILYCGICGSDRHAYHGNDPRRVPPLVLGHEAVGADEDGKQYIINPLIACGHCRHCIAGRANLCARRELIGMARPGAFAARLAMPRANLLPLPEGLPPAQAALAEPAACAWRLINLAAARLPHPLAAANALVIGAGAIGILAARALAIHGCRDIRITDNAPPRLAAAADIGIATAPANDIADDHYDVIVDAVGAPATRALACRAAASGGVIAHIGLQDGGDGLDARRLTLHEIAFVGSYTYTPAEFAATVALLAAGAFGDVAAWCDIRPLADGARAFADLDGGDAPAKIILQP